MVLGLAGTTKAGFLRASFPICRWYSLVQSSCHYVGYGRSFQHYFMLNNTIR